MYKKFVVLFTLLFLMSIPLSNGNYGDITLCPQNVTIRGFFQTNNTDTNYADFAPYDNITYVLIGNSSQMTVVAWIVGTPNCFELCRSSGDFIIKLCRVRGAFHTIEVTTKDMFELIAMCYGAPC